MSLTYIFVFPFHPIDGKNADLLQAKAKKIKKICFLMKNHIFIISSRITKTTRLSDMKTINVPKITPSEDLEKIFETLPEHAIDCCNWPKEFPYSPKATFRIFHDGTKVYIKFAVTENDIKAAVAEDQGRTWTDPCVEFFVSPQCNLDYYNFECTCTGKLLLAWHPADAPKESAGKEVLDSVERIPSLGTGTFALREGEHTWSVIEIIPVSALFRSGVESLDGKEMGANFYKCGDELPTPHFLSWNPIEWPEPSFHRPEQFGKLIFE